MPTYQYEAMDSRGLEVKDVIEATSEAEAQKKIREQGYFVTKISEKGRKKKEKTKADTKAAPKAAKKKKGTFSFGGVKAKLGR